MSTMTLGTQSRLSLKTNRSKRGNSLKRKPKSPRKLTNAGQLLVRIIMGLLTLSLIAVLGVGLLYGYRLITSHPYFELKEINISGNKRLSHGEILRTADVSLGLNCMEMNIGEVEQKLSANPWIESTTVRRDFPNRLYIDIEEKIPAFWMRQGDALYFADARGTIIAPMNPGELASLPILSVADGVTEGPRVLTGILEKIKEGQTPFTQSQTAWIKLTSAHELEIFLDGHDMGKGLTVKLSTDRWEMQLERLKIVWRDLMRRNEFMDAAIIAASGDKIWIKKRQSPSMG
ncbi:FtsQ-type POTRA domain-containing protein [Pseudodesulfovibrio sp. JC047]|uniref:cell division protein FtsQ/DivIB n=1 Tax=Pseudodesulfovibrio sp. JC047 TaxID=2683199 RepID=UPI0013CF9191|nr:FtsQ-type POTRA domain-containing protein [Pseudodesulfovibrio sp. JC047]NDV18883.1 FtsQ-type POTRA domain-containing protein [Pseudodesulfovibrio sp. JC047]